MSRMLKRIKRHISLFAICSAAAICMGAVAASCSNDAIVSTADNGSDSEAAAYYLAIKIFDTSDGAAMETRAAFDSDDNDFTGEDGNVFNKGLEAEKAIYDNYANGMPNFIMLFDKKGDKIGDLLHIKPLLTEETKNPEKEKDNSSYSLFVATLSEDDVLRYDMENRGISKVLLVLNASDYIRQKLNSLTQYDDIYRLNMAETDATNTDFLYLDVDNTTRYFTMSSSMVVKTTKAEDGTESKSVVAATESDALQNHLQPTKELARQNPFKMYVERAQSKYTVLFNKKNDDTSVQYYFDNTGATSGKYIPVTHLIYEYSDEQKDFTPNADNQGLRYVTKYSRNSSVSVRNKVEVKTAKGWKVNIAGWGVNALEKNEYLFKQIDPSAKVSEDYFNGWESSKYPYRNYWAEDKNYSDGVYPDQYREVLAWNGNNELKTDPSVKTGTKDATLNYFNFEELNKKAPHQYSPENTFNTKVFGENADLTEAYESKAFLRTGTHIIVAAQLLLDGFDVDDNKNHYADPAIGPDGLVTSVADKLYMNGIYWSKEAYQEYVAEYLAYWMLTDENQTEDKFGPNDGNFYVQDNNGYRLAKGADFELKAANIKGGDGWVYLSPNDGVTLYTKTTDEEGHDKYVAIKSEKYKNLAYEHQDLMAGHFTNGRMYYAVPVEHNKRASKDPIIATGDYGAVRNHWYSFTVNNIFSVGTPVDDPDEPIIPNPEPKNPGLGVEINIINWHKVSTGVDISSQRPNK